VHQVETGTRQLRVIGVVLAQLHVREAVLTDVTAGSSDDNTSARPNSAARGGGALRALLSQRLVPDVATWRFCGRLFHPRSRVVLPRPSLARPGRVSPSDSARGDLQGEADTESTDGPDVDERQLAGEE
jgi:hypothetical protein